MVQLFTTPVWFHGWDLLVDTIILVIALLISAYSWRIYKIEKNQQIRLLLISISNDCSWVNF